jgi:tetratricopeptide (TPR) repeat protein
MRALYTSFLVGAMLAASPAPARAEEPTQQYPECDHQPSEGEIAGAKGAFQAGQASFEEGDYNRAISYWEDAYRRDCTAHALLLNLARAYELNNQKHHAVVALQTYLARNPSAPQRDLISRRIDGLNEKIAKEEQAPAPAGSGTTNPNPPPTGGPPPTADTGGKRPLTPLIVAGAGGVVTIVGGLLYLKASGDVSDVEKKCSGTSCKDQTLADEGNSARRRRTLWGGVTVVGLAAAVGGTVWYFLSPEEGGSKTTARRNKLRVLPHVDPVVGRGFTGLSVSGTF